MSEEKRASISIIKVYSSIREMNDCCATDGVKEGQFVMIMTGNMDDPDNAKIFVKENSEYKFVTVHSDTKSACAIWLMKSDRERKADGDFIDFLIEEKEDLMSTAGKTTATCKAKVVLYIAVTVLGYVLGAGLGSFLILVGVIGTIVNFTAYKKLSKEHTDKNKRR